MDRRESPQAYFVYAGSLFLTCIVVTALVRLDDGAFGWSFKWQLVAAFAVTALLAALFIARRDRAVLALLSTPLIRGAFGDGVSERSTGTIGRVLQRACALLAGEDVGTPEILRSWQPRILGVASAVFVCALVGLLILCLDHRKYLAIVAFAEVACVYALDPSLERRFLAPLTMLAILTWTLTSGISYTHLDDWLLNGAPWSNLAVPSFVLAFGLVLSSLTDAHLESAAALKKAKAKRIGIAVAAMFIFAFFSFRTENMAIDWIPWHRSYFTDIAQMVRGGHWLLYDVPSLYGFLSVLAVAIMPARNGWQALYELLGVFLTAQALMTFVILRWGRSGTVNTLVAIGIPLATLIVQYLSRYEQSARLYPQGGMRFIWVCSLLFVIFLMAVWRDRSRLRVALHWTGYLLWLIAMFWSIENAVWATTMWIPFLLIESTIDAFRNGFGAVLGACAKALAPIVVLPVAFVLLVDLVYRTHLGVMPDWSDYAQFLGGFVHGNLLPTELHPQYLGGCWTIALSLTAVGSVGVLVIARRQWRWLPLVSAAWLAIWATASYYAIEPLDLYTRLLLAIQIPAMAIAGYVGRALDGGIIALFSRLALVPIAVIAMSFMLGSTSDLAAMQLPFTKSFTFDVTSEMPPVSGELGALFARAGVRPTDGVIVPTGPYWTEIDQGLILPFVRLPDGRISEYRAWLPMSAVAPAMLWNALPNEKRAIVAKRFLQEETGAGWYATYRSSAQCERLSSLVKTVRVYRSPNFALALCARR